MVVVDLEARLFLCLSAKSLVPIQDTTSPLSLVVGRQEGALCPKNALH